MKHFSNKEVACHHCGALGLTPEMKEKLDALRETLGRPVVLTSAYRCPKHPIEKRKKTPGTHAQGIAVDIKVDTVKEVSEIVRVARSLGFQGLGIADTFVHIDLRPVRMWWPY